MINCSSKWMDVIKSQRNIVHLSGWKNRPNCRHSDNGYSRSAAVNCIILWNGTILFVGFMLTRRAESRPRFDQYTTFSPWNDYRIADSRRRKWLGFIARASYCAPPRLRKWLQLITSFPVACYVRIWYTTCPRSHLLLSHRKRSMLGSEKNTPIIELNSTTSISCERKKKLNGVRHAL